ncbi:MAG: lytic transglycosylase domain-containing protein [Gemmatimonadales bacterium]
MKRPTDKYNEVPGNGTRRLVIRGGMVFAAAALIVTLAGWTRRVSAVDTVRLPDMRLVVSRLGSLGQQLDAARGEVALTKLQLDRANAVMASSSKYQIPADLAASIYDIALSEGIDPALGYQLVKIESNFKADARSNMGALGYTQVQLATARFYEPQVTEKVLLDRDTNLRIGFRFLNDLLERFDHDTHLALLAYNRGPTRVSAILARGGNPANGYSAAVMKGYAPPRTIDPGWR